MARKSAPATRLRSSNNATRRKSTLKTASVGRKRRRRDNPSDASDDGDASAREEKGESENSGDEEYNQKVDSEEEEEKEESVKEYDSDALDDDDGPKARKKTLKRKRGNTVTTQSPKKKKTVPSRRSSTKSKRNVSDGEDDQDGPELDDGQEIVGTVVQAPTKGQVPPGQISQNTFDFLMKLQDPKCNDREWFKLHEPVYRQAEKEWKDFIEEFTNVIMEVDPQIPPLPPKDLIHRIYRDVRFSNDKTPYKKGFSATMTRSGRKGTFAGFQPGGESFIASGIWCTGRNELATIRANIQRNSTRLRRVLSAPEFVKHFGEPKPRSDGGKRSIFGMEDELKVAPKGIDKGHKDIDLLKCRSFAVFHKFTDEEVLAVDFKDKLADVVKVMRPFVYCVNDMMTIAPDDDGSDDPDEN